MTGVKDEGTLEFDRDLLDRVKLKGSNWKRGIVSKRLVFMLILTVLMFLVIIDGVGADSVVKNVMQKGAEINLSANGVVAINTHKSIYLPAEEAFIGIGVLDSRGRMVCDADVTLIITDPDEERTFLSTKNGGILVSDQCAYYGVTDLPDYYANYKVGDAGTYQMDLTAITHEGVQSIGDHFSVQADADFDVVRSGPTRIYPWVPYTMGITITADEDYEGPISEYVPASFKISPQEGLRIEMVGDIKVLIWNKRLRKGETYTLSYEFDAPDVSPYLFSLKGLEIGGWRELSSWMIASDLVAETKFFDDFNDGDLLNPTWTLAPDDGHEWNVEGSRAHIDKAAPPGDNITSVNIDLSGTLAYANLSFDWEITAFDDGECIAAHADDGTGSVQLWQTCANAGNEPLSASGTEIIKLTQYVSMTSTVTITFECITSANSEHCYIDNVQVIAYTASPGQDLTNFTIFESSSTSLGTGQLICSLTGLDDGTPDTCINLEASKDYRVEMQITNDGEVDGALNNVTWGDISNLLTGGGTVNTGATCIYSDNQYAGGESSADSCAYSSGEVKFDTSSEPILEVGTYIWVSIVFTTGSSSTSATTTVNPYAGGYNDTSDQITIPAPAPTLTSGTLESQGLDGYGWRQVYGATPDFTTGAATRLTGTVDREYYDWGFKEIMVSGRRENYWSKDSGWWYVSGESSLNFKLNDSKNDVVYTNRLVSTSKGRATVTHTWTSSDDPGEWIAYIDDWSDLYLSFKFYVRGQLNITDITTNATNPLYPNSGDTVIINATLKDHAGNYINWSYKDNNNTDITPNVTAFITGAGEDFVVNLTNYQGDGYWNGSFTPQKPGDHLIIVSATDGHTYWVDGRGSQWIYVNGTFPPDGVASIGLWMFLRDMDGFGNILKLFFLSSLFLGLVFIKVWWR